MEIKTLLISGAILGFIIAALSGALILLWRAFSVLRKGIAPTIDLNTQLMMQRSALAGQVQSLQQELAAAKREFVIGLSDRQVETLALSINNIRGRHEMPEHTM